MTRDPYQDLANRYDWMFEANPTRELFFSELFVKHKVSKVLDCACGTGRDVILFHSMGLDVQGSDLSPAMLTQARINIQAAAIDATLFQASFCELPGELAGTFDCVVCLTNSINEILDDSEAIMALRSMKSVLRKGGILVLDQGQTDASLSEKPRFATIINSRDQTRFFVMDYFTETITVNIFDFIHAADESFDKHSAVQIKVRLQDRWSEILRDAGFANIEFFGSWKGAKYNKATSRRLIVVAN